eukprot:14497751-Ditylum_brightwellii.AAC.1
MIVQVQGRGTCPALSPWSICVKNAMTAMGERALGAVILTLRYGKILRRRQSWKMVQLWQT